MHKTFPRQYLSKEFDPTHPESVKKAYGELEQRAVESVAELEKWVLDWEELSSVIHDRYSRAYVDSTVDTNNTEAEQRYLSIVEHILPLTETHGFELSRKLLASPHASSLSSYYDCLLRTTKAEVELFREENVPLKTEERKLTNEFEKIMGSLSVNFRGEELTMQQVARYLEDPMEATRKEAFEARASVRLKRADELDDLYDRMLAVRDKIAKNAGFASFRDYQFLAYHRFDYGPNDCVKFHEAIEKHIVPLVRTFHDDRKKKLGATTLRPWNTLVDPESKKALQPFEKVDQLVSRCQTIFNKVDPELGEFFSYMAEEGLLNLESRKGKAPGGYCTDFSEAKVPFIFMNAAGTKRDVETLLHEGGHAFHYFLARDQKLNSYHNTGMEFAEVASMSMELLSRPYLDEFYAKEDLPRVLAEQLRKVMEFFPFMAMIDAFQHWVYTSPNHDRRARQKKWAELEARFQPSLDWTGHENYRNIGWQYPHVFSVPFYYVEYGIAQLGALSVWRQSLENYRAAVKSYKDGLRLGGSRPLPELFSAVGAKFGLSGETIKPIVASVKEALQD